MKRPRPGAQPTRRMAPRITPVMSSLPQLFQLAKMRFALMPERHGNASATEVFRRRDFIPAEKLTAHLNDDGPAFPSSPFILETLHLLLAST